MNLKLTERKKYFMAGSTYGNILRIKTWGASHGKGLGVVVDGCSSGVALLEEDIKVFVARRETGR